MEKVSQYVCRGGAWIPELAWQSIPTITRDGYILYVFLMSYAPDSTLLSISDEQLAEDSTVPLKRVPALIEKLEEAGLLDILRRRDGSIGAYELPRPSQEAIERSRGSRATT